MHLPLKLTAAVLSAGATVAALACDHCAPRAAQAVPAAAMAVVRDPNTGQLRAPTSAEAAALQGSPRSDAKARTNARSTRTAAVPAVQAYPSGAQSARLPRDLASYSVVTRSPDGTLSSHCVEGEQAALALTRRSAAPVRPARTIAHDTE